MSQRSTLLFSLISLRVESEQELPKDCSHDVHVRLFA
jgi:hypothetical protein